MFGVAFYDSLDGEGDNVVNCVIYFTILNYSVFLIRRGSKGPVTYAVKIKFWMRSQNFYSNIHSAYVNFQIVVGLVPS